jgi:hypothetical protein
MSVFKYHAFIFLDRPPPWRTEQYSIHCICLSVFSIYTKVLKKVFLINLYCQAKYTWMILYDIYLHKWHRWASTFSHLQMKDFRLFLRQQMGKRQNFRLYDEQMVNTVYWGILPGLPFFYFHLKRRHLYIYIYMYACIRHKGPRAACLPWGSEEVKV